MMKLYESCNIQGKNMAVVFLISLVFCICIGSVTSAEEVDCYNRYTKGTDYAGKVSGPSCIKWSVVKKHPNHNYTEDHNYCRNPLPSDNLDRPFCFTNGQSWAFEKCNVPACDCRNSTQDLLYNGEINVTRRGYNCTNWNEAGKHTSEKQNYCRTPARDPDNADGPWCYTGLTDPYWDRCNIPVCESAKCPDLCVKKNLKPLDGKTTYRYGEIVILTCETGYSINGSKFLACQPSGQWNDTIPNCQAVPCPGLSEVPNQKLDPVQRTYSFRDTVKFKCDEGYELSSTDTITCQSDGTWSNTQPNCTDKLQSKKDSVEIRRICMSYGLFGGILTAIVTISAGVYIGTCFYYRKRLRKHVTVYEDMQLNTVERQNSRNEETYTELT